MGKVKKGNNQDRDANAPPSNQNRRYFGLIYAIIDHKNRRVELNYSPRYKDPLSDEHRQRCLIWAFDSLADLRADGYIFAFPEALESTPSLN